MSDISAEALLKAFPEQLTGTESFLAFAQVAAEAMAELKRDNAKIAVYRMLNSADEGLLDILAKDFNILWYDGSAPLEVKRALVMSAFYVWRTVGTAAAVKQAVSDAYGPAELTEWFDEPFSAGFPTYRLTIEPNEVPTEEVIAKIARQIEIYGNVRSYLERLTTTMSYQNRLYRSIIVESGTLVEVAVPYAGGVDFLTDELGNLLTDELGNVLIL